jgi:hypothetical protein
MEDRLHRTARLEKYILRAHFGEDLNSNEMIFGNSPTRVPPTLENDRINRIIIYPGAFNPPHLYHMQVLRHGLQRSGQDLNVITAIVLPQDDEEIVEKRNRTIFFPMAQRLRLWGADSHFWVYGGGHAEFELFKDRLERIIVQDGYQLEFVLLCGGDNIKNDDSTPDHRNGTNISGLLVTDVGKPVMFVSGFARPLIRLKNFEPWEKLALVTEEFTYSLINYAYEQATWRVSQMPRSEDDIFKERELNLSMNKRTYSD